jgi:hypothetical protein
LEKKLERMGSRTDTAMAFMGMLRVLSLSPETPRAKSREISNLLRHDRADYAGFPPVSAGCQPAVVETAIKTEQTSKIPTFSTYAL